MRGRSGRIGVLAAMAAVVVILVAAAVPGAAQADVPWSIGAAKIDTTPPLFDTAQDLVDFPEVDLVRGVTCPRMLYSGPRVWRFEEPYQDTDGSGDFNYPLSGGPGTAPAPEPFCDYNHNGRWEGIYLSGGADHRAVVSGGPIPGYTGPAHDPIDARAVAFSDGTKTVALVSVVAQGIFENYLREARAMAQGLAGQPAHASCGQIDEMVVSSNHNESSPDTVGIYGAPADPTGTFGLNSGIDEYYMDWLDEQIANVAVEACDNREPASLRAVEFPVPSDLELEIPNRFPTADDYGNLAAVDQKVRLLQARDANGDPIFTMLNLGAHNQELGHSDSFEESHTLSSDWPGYFHRRLEEQIGGVAMFLAGDNGSQEDLITEPRVTDPECAGGAGCYPQVEATGERIADHVASQAANAEPVPLGAVNGRRTEFCAPVENNLFKAAFAGGLFGERQAYTNCVPTGEAGTEAKTSVAVLDIGPDLQFLANPGEAFPSLTTGGPWGIEDASCPTAPNPPVPAWHASAKFRFRAGLADDLIGYEKQAWSFEYGTQTFPPQYGCSGDSKHTRHVLEDEALGPTASTQVAEELTALLDADPDPAAEIRLGRYVKADGSLTDAYVGPTYSGAPGHWPTDAVAIWLAAPGTTTLNATPGQPDSGTIVALDSVGSFGSRSVDANGDFMDFDGAEDANGPSVATRGMLVRDGEGGVAKRYYVDVYPALTVSGTLASALPYPGYARPKAATPATITLVPAYDECTDGDSTHGAPLSISSCNPPVQTSDYLTVGTPDSNGRPAVSAGKLKLKVVGENPMDPDNGDQADIEITMNVTDVRKQSDLSDYTGELHAVIGLRITDRFNGAGLRAPATVTEAPLSFSVPCSVTTGSEGGACSLITSADAVMSGIAREGQRAVWGVSQVQVFDGGSDGDADTTGDNTLFAVQGAFVP